ncbi:hypothetical protein F2Q68_00046204 [Brassica cretica]|uniref:Uncharacterized protein n=1 Tax=Brassica cretica TaxID=69181 RepID=A0A8S9LKZ8_BRACR|nr:hypothetical protein F2Q68_00046204 [Brassica cretica]
MRIFTQSTSWPRLYTQYYNRLSVKPVKTSKILYLVWGHRKHFGFSVEETKRMTGETMVILTGEFKSGDNKTPNRALSEEGLQTLAREIKALTMSMLLSEEENQTASDISLGEP